jgi:hypothetical protein
MDDGYADRKGFMLCTDSFLKDDVILLARVLKEKFGLDCSVRERTPSCNRIYIKYNSMDAFCTLVEPHFHPSMMYKLRGGLVKESSSKPLPPKFQFPQPKKNLTEG